MAVLYLTEQRSIVRKTSERLVVQKDKEVLLEIPCDKVDTVLIYGNVQVTTQALAEMLEHGIELAFLSTSGKLRGQLTPPKPKNVPLRMRQYEIVHSQDGCLPLARGVVQAKIANSVSVLRIFRAHHEDAVSLAVIQELEARLPRLEEMRILEELLGLEGASAATYFQGLAGVVPSWAGFSGRNRRPPRDAFNALLSFGYVLVGNEIQCLLDAMGYDPYLGFFHKPEYGRPSLGLDLLEEFRAPLVDRLSVKLLKLRILDADDFRDTPEGGVLLKKEAMKKFFPAYEKEVTTPIAIDGESLSYRQLFRRQAERLARTLLQGELYEPFRLPC